jgi:hypothetical protein
MTQERIPAEIFRNSEGWHGWLFEAKKRHWLSVLNYVVASNQTISNERRKPARHRQKPTARSRTNRSEIRSV